MNLSDCNKYAYDEEPEADDVVALVDDLLSKAVKYGASDIHFEPTSGNLAVKYRLDGELIIVEKLPKSIAYNVIARLKVLGGLLTYRNDIPQEGRIELPQAQNGVIDKRLAIFPTIYGQRAVIRLFYQHKELTELDQLGFQDEIYSALRKISVKGQGLLLLTGPAGSGKSTTLAALLRYILKNYPGKSIVTLEDPVEIRIEGITQTQITPYGQMTFPTALRSLLRQDPRILMIGEIRDAETAAIAIEAGLAGHFLMSTMHSGTPSGALIRLLEMGIEPYLVTSSVTAVLNQRLLRKLCEKCKIQDKEGKFQAAGCENCFNTGYKGRALIAEIIQLDGDLRKALLGKFDLEQFETLLEKKGHSNMYTNGQDLVLKGITTQEELNKVCGIA